MNIRDKVDRLKKSEKLWRTILLIATEATSKMHISDIKRVAFRELKVEECPPFMCYLCSIKKNSLYPDCDKCPLLWQWSATTGEREKRCTDTNGLYKKLTNLNNATSDTGLFLIETVYDRIVDMLKRDEDKLMGSKRL